MRGYRAQDGIERSGAQRPMIRYAQPLMSRNVRVDNDMAADAAVRAEAPALAAEGHEFLSVALFAPHAHEAMFKQSSGWRLAGIAQRAYNNPRSL
jgi:hypothetical protein